MQQNTKEWLEMRRKSIGASDAPIIMGVSPWTTPYQLWQQKLGLIKDEDNTQKAYGRMMEEPARRAYIDFTGNFITPEVVIHPTRPYMHASLDGLCLKRNIAVEIKNVGYEDHLKAQRGQIPDKYYPQLQHQLACIGSQWLHYFSFREGNGILVEVERDDAYIETLYAEEDKFWDKLQNLIEPEQTDRDFKEFTDYELAAKWRAVSFQLDELEKLEKEYRRAIIEAAGDHSAIGYGIRLTKVVRKGNVDYKAIPELEGVDLEKYRKAPIQSMRLTSCKY